MSESFASRRDTDAIAVGSYRPVSRHDVYNLQYYRRNSAVRELYRAVMFGGQLFIRFFKPVVLRLLQYSETGHAVQLDLVAAAVFVFGTGGSFVRDMAWYQRHLGEADSR